MSYFAISDLCLRLQQFQLRNVSLAIDQGKTLVLLGPSGSGKSVLLETIAGFYVPCSGRIELSGRQITSLPPEARGLGFMFQDYALFPHFTVEQNVAFGLRVKHHAAQRVEEVLRLAGAQHLIGRRPATLSGGEKQRVALARALAIEPQLFLFDEPLSALDAKMREELREDLRRLLRSVQATSVYVTHDRIEALMLADVIAIIQDGVILQVGAPQEVFARPVDAWVAQFLGMQLFSPRFLEPIGPNRVKARVGDSVLEATMNGRFSPATARLAFYPEDVQLEHLNGHPLPMPGGVPAMVEATIPLGVAYRVDLNSEGRFSALLSRQDYQRLGLKIGDRVLARFDPSRLILIPPSRQ